MVSNWSPGLHKDIQQMWREWEENHWWGCKNTRYEKHINNGSSIAILKLSSIIEIEEDNIRIIQADKAIWEDWRRWKERKIKKISIRAKEIEKIEINIRKLEKKRNASKIQVKKERIESKDDRIAIKEVEIENIENTNTSSKEEINNRKKSEIHNWEAE